MDHYDYYNDLLPERFEDFSIDLVQKVTNTTFEVFSRVKDKGIDARGEVGGKTIILQAKRYAEYKDLRKVLKTELEKVKKLKPDRYIFITSAKLTVSNKDEMLEIFKDYINNRTDIIGREDIDNLISSSENLDILEKYNELWIKNTHVIENILSRILNRSINEESKFQLKKIMQKDKIYAENQYFYIALNILEEKHFLLIYGDAGVGKSSLAGHLCNYYLKKMEKAEFIYTDSLDRLRKKYKSDKEQIIFLDDFWGSWKKDKNGNNADTRQLKQTIEMIEEDKNKILIITSREYIFRQFEEENYGDKKIFENASIAMRMTKYTDLQKAKILFKQIENTSWEWNDIYQITQNYQEIIEHPNYNPRIIEMAIDQIERTKELKYEEIYEELFKAIEEPEEFLNAMFYGQKEGAQIICILLLLFSGEMNLEILRMMFCDYIDEEGKTEDARKEHFKDYIKQLENSMTETYRKDYEEDGEVIIIFKNATIEESIQKYLTENIYAYSKNIIKTTKYLNPILALCNVCNDYTNYEIYREKLEIEKELQEQIIEKIITEYEKLKLYNIEEYYEDIIDNIPKQGIEKLIAIVKTSRKLKNEKLSEWIISKAEELWESIESNNINYYEKAYLPELLEELKKSELYLTIEPKEILESFYKNINFASEYITFNEIGKIYPKEYEDLMKIYGVNIKEKIKMQIEKDEKYFEENKFYIEQDYLYEGVIDELHKIYYGSFWLEDEKIETPTKQYQNYKEDGDIQKEIEKLLGLEFKSLEEKDKVEYISNLEVSIEDKKMLLESINKWYISPFFRSRESIDGIIEFLLTRKEVKAGSFVIELLLERLNKSKLNPNIIKDIAIIANDGLRCGNLMFKMDSIYSYGIDKEEIQELIKAKIFYKVGNWIRFDNLEVLIYLSLIVNFWNNDLEEILYGIMFICERSGYSVEDIIFQLCEEINKTKFYEEIVKPSLSYFIEQIDKTNEITIAKSIISLLQMSINKETKEDEQYISTIGLSKDIPILGLPELVVVYVTKDIMEELIKIEIEKFKNYMENEKTVNLYKNLDNKKFINILQETGMIILLNRMYRKLKNEL